MAKQLTDTEVAWAALVKAVRSQVRLRHSIKADRELNEAIPALEKKFMAAAKKGEEKKFVLSEIVRILDAIE